MPQYIRTRYMRWRRRRDWLIPAEIRYLDITVRDRLTKTVKEIVAKDRFRWCLFRLTEACWGIAFLFFAIIAVLTHLEQELDIPEAYGLLAILLLPIGHLLLIGAAFRWRYLFYKVLRQRMLAECIPPGVCFECRYFTEGFEGSECPVCGALLYDPPWRVENCLADR